ncbi:MAG: METTL5 family protein [Infirmifilum sp.]
MELEQYATPSALASTLLWLAEHHYQDIYSKRVVDLGAGTGRLGIGAALLGASQIMLVDVDTDALRVAWDSLKRMNLTERFDLIAADIQFIPIRDDFTFDTAIQNPPFGVHRRGYDFLFVEKALSLARVVYSIHKERSSDYIVRRVEELGFNAGIIYRERICIPHMFEWHRKPRHCFTVAVIRIIYKREKV